MNTLRDKLRAAKRKRADGDAMLRGNATAFVKMSLVRAQPTEQTVDWQSCGPATPQADLSWTERRPLPPPQCKNGSKA